MKIKHIETLITRGSFSTSKEWKKIRRIILRAVKNVAWPPGSGKFTIYPESGKKRGKGNGVVPIKSGLLLELGALGWKSEIALPIAVHMRPGELDIGFETPYGVVVIEWETGNVSSSHRALNKMTLGLLRGQLAAGILIVPSREFAKFLTDRIGNFPELKPYLDLWRSIPCESGILEVIVIEHDATSLKVPRIPKGTDGRAQA